MNRQELLQKFNELDGTRSYIHVTADDSSIEFAFKKREMDADCQHALEFGRWIDILVDCYLDAAQREQMYR